jgi:hypothetical protein
MTVSDGGSRVRCRGIGVRLVTARYRYRGRDSADDADGKARGASRPLGHVKATRASAMTSVISPNRC